MPDAPVVQRALSLAQKVMLQYDVRPPRFIQRMDQVKVDVVCLQLSQLLIQKTIEIRRLLHHPCRELGREAHLFAISISERLANNQFAFAFVIGIRGVDVIHAMIDGRTQHPRRFSFVDVRAAPLPICAREPHGAKSQRRSLPVQFSELAILHDRASPHPRAYPGCKQRILYPIARIVSAHARVSPATSASHSASNVGRRKVRPARLYQ